MIPKEVTCRTIKDEKVVVPVEQLEWRVSVYGIIIRDGHILLAKEFADGYDFPGGGMEKGEKIAEALAREVHEETGLTATLDRLVHVAEDFFVSIAQQRKLQSILLYYTCKDISGEISTDYLDGNEKLHMQAAEWVPLDRIDEVKFYNAVESPTLIRKALSL